MKRRGTAVWTGSGLEGSGRLNTFSGAIRDLPYSTALRFENEDGRAGTNPEELIAAAHAGCFAMALSFQLTNAGHVPDELNVESAITIEKEDSGWSLRSSALTLRARVPGIEDARFRELAEKAKAGCPVSRALAIDVSLDAQLV